MLTTVESWRLLLLVALMLSGFAAQQMGWHGLASRLFGYMSLCAVGYVISWICLATERGGSGNLDSGDRWNSCLTSA